MFALLRGVSKFRCFITVHFLTNSDFEMSKLPELQLLLACIARGGGMVFLVQAEIATVA